MKDDFTLISTADKDEICTDAKMHGLLKGTGILRYYGDTKAFRVKGEKAAKRADRCADAKKRRGIVGFVGRGFGELCQNRPVMLNLIQHLSISIDSINIDRLRVCLVARVKRVCNVAAFASPFRPLRTIRKPAMTGRFPSIGEMENISCAKRTVKNLLPYSPINLLPSKKVAFTKPSRGTSDSERRTIINGNRVFRFDCERYRLMRGAAFTLAEVLITLGIIGVVAAITLPSVIEHHQKQVVVTRMKKFYSTFNQALQMSTIDNGAMSDWTYPTNYYDYAGSYTFWETYLKPYMKYTDEKKQVYTIWPTIGVDVFLPDGSAFNLAGTWVTFYPVANRRDKNHVPRTIFLFILNNKDGKLVPREIAELGLFEGGTVKAMMECGQKQYPSGQRNCAALIYKNNWQIPSDYPW